MKKYQEKTYCEVCGEELIFVPHYEYDGVTECGNYEPYFECANGCLYPDVPDEELTAEELKTRNKVDTCTEFGIVEVSTEPITSEVI